MTLILSGTNGLSDVDGDASTPAIRGSDSNTGIFFGTDIIGFSEGGTEAMRINADAQIVAAAGTASLPVITTTGDVNTGIFFPAADTIAFTTGGTTRGRWTTDGLCFNADTAAANALDDYEEGTFTPEIADAITGGNTGTAGAATGTYTKIGRLVNIIISLVNMNTSGMTAGNILHIRGLPFANSSQNAPLSCYLDSFNFTNFVTPRVAGSSSYFVLHDNVDSANDVLLLVSSVTSGTADIFINGTYFV
jgi:hypothetical protein